MFTVFGSEIVSRCLSKKGRLPARTLHTGNQIHRNLFSHWHNIRTRKTYVDGLMDNVILREALWPYFAQRLPALQSVWRGDSLVLAYWRAELDQKALRLAEDIWRVIALIEGHLPPYTWGFARLVARLYRNAECESDAQAIEKRCRQAYKSTRRRQRRNVLLGIAS